MAARPACGDIYNVHTRAPQSDKVCDRCGNRLVQRSDDPADLIQERLKTYDGETLPLVTFYKNLGVYHRVNGMRPIEEVTKEILAILDGVEVRS